MRSEIRRFFGMVTDILKSRIPENKYYTAENINLTPNNKDEIGGATGVLGSKFAVSLGRIDVDGNDYMAWRLPVDLTSAGIVHDFNIDGTLFQITTSGPNPGLRLTNFINDLEAATVFVNGDVYLQDLPATTGVNYIGFKTVGGAHELLEVIDSVYSDERPIIIKEYFGVGANGYFRPIKSIYINTNLFILSTNGVVFRIGVAKKNYTAKTWAYTVLLETNQITYTTDEIIDLDGEIDSGGRVSLYWTGDNILPRNFYINEQDTWVANSGLRFYDSLTENPEAYYIYDSLLAETTLQVLENYARVSEATVLNSGGVLPSGNYQYFIRQKRDDGVSGAGLGSGLASIFTASLTNTRLYGSVDTEITSKSVQLTVTGLNPDLYEKFEVIAVKNTSGVFTAQVIGEYEITSTEQEVLHTGTGVLADIALTELVTAQVVIKTAKNLVIGRNRIFLGNTTLYSEPDLRDAFKTVTLETIIDYLTPVGENFSTVNEYMKPENIYNRTGYMWLETYRFGGLTFLKNGIVLPPYFIEDYQIGSSGVTSFELVNPADGVAVYGVKATINIPTFPDIDGVPFYEAVHSIAIVRQDCVQEVLATGYILPRTYTMLIDGLTYYMVGSQVGGSSIVTANAALSFNERYLGFLSPDILFGVSSLESITTSHQIYNYGQPSRRPLDGEFVYDAALDRNDAYILAEYLGDVSSTPDMITPTGQSQLLAFNSVGTLPISGTGGDMRFRTAPGGNYLAGVMQRMIGFSSSNDADVVTANTDYGLRYAIIFNPISNKYGAETDGFYKSTNNLTVITDNSIVETNVWGGDIFTQKTFIKGVSRGTFGVALESIIGGGTVPTGTIDYRIRALAGVNTVESFLLSIVNTTPNAIITIEWNYPEIGTVTGFDILRRHTAISPNWERIATVGVTYSYVDSIGVSGAVDTNVNPTLNRRSGISIYSQNRGNYQLRSFDPNNVTDNNLNYPYTTTSLQDWLQVTAAEGELNYTRSYSPLQPPESSRVGYNSNDEIVTAERATVYYSDLKVGGRFDAYKIYRALNKKDYPLKFGEISNLFIKDMNYLVIMMNEIVLFQSLNQQATQTGTDGVTITIGDGTVLGAREQAISNIGSPFKTFANSYKDNRGVNHITWFNPYLKKWMRWTGDADDIGDMTYNQSFLTEKTDLNFTERSVVFGHDFINDEVLLTAAAEIPGAVVYDAGDTYAEGDIVWITLNSVIEQRRYFKARMAVPVDKTPSLPLNQVHYWEPYRQSNFTLVFNEKNRVMSDTRWCVPAMYLQFNETYLTHAINTDTEESNLYEHNTIAELYDDIELESSVTIIFNNFEQYFKKFRIMLADINIKPYFIIVRTGDFVTYADENQISPYRPLWGANVMNDATITGSNPNGLNTVFAAQPSGETCEVTLFFKNLSATERTTFKEMIMKFEPLPPFYDK